MIRRFGPALAAAFLLGASLLPPAQQGRTVDGENDTGLSFRPIAAGEFRMGTQHGGSFEELEAAFADSIKPGGDEPFARDESPRRAVRITRPFRLSACEVTVGQFRRFVLATSYRTTAESSGEGIVGWGPPSADETRRTGRLRPFARKPEYIWRKPGFAQDDSHPVVGVSWEDARAYCRWLSGQEGVRHRLPTEAEWEYACRAGSDAWFSWGDIYRGRLHRLANLAGVELEKAQPDAVLRQWLVDVERDPPDGFVFTAPVGRFPANRWGLYDLHGNVWEWCEDVYSELAYGQGAGRTPAPVRDPLHAPPGAGAGLRVIRGGSWYTGPVMARSASRGYFDPADAACYLGFRVVREGAGP